MLKIWVTFWSSGLKCEAAISKKLNHQTSSVSSVSILFFKCGFFFFWLVFFIFIFVSVLLSIHLKISSVNGLRDVFVVVVKNISELYFFLKCIRGILNFEKPNFNGCHNQGGGAH